MASGERTLMVRFLGDSTSAEKATHNVAAAGDKLTASSNVTGQALGDMKSKLLGLVPGASNAEGALSKMGAASEGTGISMKGALAGGAAAAGVAIAGMAAEGVNKFSALTAEVTKFKNVTGASTSEANQFVAVAHGMGVETDVLSGAMFKMGNNIATTPDKFQDLGIAIAKNKDGTTDMVGTLENAAEAWRNSNDATKKDEIAKLLNGKAGAALIPILKQGSAAVKEFADEAKKRNDVTDADLKQGAEYRKSMREIGLAVQGVEISLGRGLVPALSDATHRSTEMIDAANSLTQKVGGLGGVVKVASEVINPFGAIVGHVTDLFGHHSKAVDASKESTGQLTAAEVVEQESSEKVADLKKDEEAAYKAASKAIDDHVKSMQDATKASEDAMGADIAFAKAMDDTTLVSDKVAAAQDNLNVAIRDHGTASAEARQATVDLNSAILGGEETYRTAADKAVELIAKHHEMAGEVYTNEQRHQDLITKLGEFAGQLADGSEMRTNLNKYIAELNSVPGNITTQIAITGVNGGQDFQIVRRAAGGPAGGLTLVGEQGPELVSLPGGSYVHNNTDSRAMLAGAGGGGTTIVLQVTGVVVGTMQQLATALGPHLVGALNRSARRGTNMGAALGLS